MDKETLKSLYDIVFDEDGNVKPCGRQNCINLITFINGVTHTEGIYGNKDTGHMEVEAIKQFVQSKGLI